MSSQRPRSTSASAPLPALASVVTAMTIANYGVFLGILAGLAVGVVVGSVNGALVAMLKIPSFLVTLGMLAGIIATGLTRC